MERFGIQNRTLVSFLLVLFLFISSNCFVSNQTDNVNEGSGSEQERVSVRVGLVLDLGSVDGKIVGSSVSLALSDFYAVNSDYKTRVSLSVRNSQREPLLALASGNSGYILSPSYFLSPSSFLFCLHSLTIYICSVFFFPFLNEDIYNCCLCE